MAASVRDLAAQLSMLGYNPAAAQRAVLQSWSDVSSGKIQIVDPSNPVVLSLESACVLSMNAMSKYAVLNRKQYPVAAQDQEDLYLHMSDVDYIGRFATPATDSFYMMLPYAELLSKLVADPVTGIKKVVIPRNTKITVADTVFMIQYPIEIRQLLHGGIQIVYDTTQTSPLQTLSDNVLKWDLVSDGNLTYLRFAFQVIQMDAASVTQNANAATLFSYQYAYSDQFYYARVWVQNPDKTWTEIKTTHSDQVYDITVPTAVLKVDEDNNLVTVSLPQIYTASGTIKTAVRMDIYTTKGAINLVLDNYSMGLFQVKFQAFDQNDITQYTAPLSSLSSLFAYSTSTIAAGTNGVTFDDLRQQVINNSVGPQTVPISNVNLQDALQKLGFTVITNIDNITNRNFLASRALPLPVNSTLLTAAGTTNATVSFSLDQLTGFSYVVDNTAAQNAMTLTPDALWKDVNGVVSLVPDGEIAMLEALPPDQKALLVSNGNYLYTPFHYVLDSTGDNFEVRPYYLDDPVIQTKLFVSDNDTTLLQVNVAPSYGIVRTATGYAIQIQTSSGPSFQQLPDDQIYVLLSFVPEGEKDRAYLVGTLAGRDSTGKERIYQFDLSSNMNVDANNCIQLSKFRMFTTEPRLVGSPLTQDFDVIFATTAVMDSQWVSAEVDAALGYAKGVYVPISTVGITHEALRVQFGTALDTLWARARSVISTIVYETWDMDVPATYPNDVYQRDPQTGSVITIVNGQPTYTILHHKGDPVLDSNNNPVLLYTKGQIKIDPATGAPIPSNPRGMTRQIDFMLIEGVYKFATDNVAASYRQQMIGTLLTWMTGSLENLNQRLLEQSSLYFYPKKTIGQVDVMIGASLKTTMEAGQSLTLTLYVDSSVYKNQDLRTRLELTATQICAMQLTQQQVSRDMIEDALATAFGTDVVGLELTGLGGTDRNWPVFTILDDSIRASLRKKLIALTDDSLVLTEDLTVVFVQHDQSALTNAPAGT
jgi:hypothetical protein